MRTHLVKLGRRARADGRQYLPDFLVVRVCALIREGKAGHNITQLKIDLKRSPSAAAWIGCHFRLALRVPSGVGGEGGGFFTTSPGPHNVSTRTPTTRLQAFTRTHARTQLKSSTKRLRNATHTNLPRVDEGDELQLQLHYVIRVQRRQFHVRENADVTPPKRRGVKEAVLNLHEK